MVYETFAGKQIGVTVRHWGYSDQGLDRTFVVLTHGDQGSPRETLVNTHRILTIEELAE